MMNYLLKTVPQFKELLDQLKPCPPGRPDWWAYTHAKQKMSLFIGWDADPSNLRHLPPEDQKKVLSSEAYDAMIQAIGDKLNV